jgi:CheY-like chemotaxis protein
MAWVFAPGIDEGSIMTEEKSQSVRVLMVEDVVSDAELTLLHLKMAGLQCVSKRVETETGLRDALREFAPDIILSDFSLPQFDGLGALKIAHEMAQDVPFIFGSAPDIYAGPKNCQELRVTADRSVRS